MNLVEIIKKDINYLPNHYGLDEKLLSNVEAKVDDAIKTIKSNFKSTLYLFLGVLDVVGVVLTYIKISKICDVSDSHNGRYSIGCEIFDRKEGPWFITGTYNYVTYDYCYKAREEVYKNGLLNGIYITRSLCIDIDTEIDEKCSTIIETKGEYVNNVKCGKWIDHEALDDEGNTSTNGCGRSFTSIGLYDNGKRTGLWMLYDYKNVIRYYRQYSNGEIISTKAASV